MFTKIYKKNEDVNIDRSRCDRAKCWVGGVGGGGGGGGGGGQWYATIYNRVLEGLGGNNYVDHMFVYFVSIYSLLEYITMQQ